jgi:hypothetical protein
MDEHDVFTRTMENLGSERTTWLTASLRYRAARARAAGQLACAAWHDSLADLVITWPDQADRDRYGTRSAATSMRMETDLLPERDLARLIIEYEVAIADFENHCGGALLKWWRAVLAILRQSLSARRGTLSAVDA